MKKFIFLLILCFGGISVSFGQLHLGSDTLTISEGAIMYVGTDFQTVQSTGDLPVIEIGDSLFVTGNIDLVANTSVNGSGWLVLNGNATQGLDFGNAAIPKMLLDNLFDVVLNENAVINDSLLFQNGKVEIGAYDLTVGAPNVNSGGIAGMSSSRYVRTNGGGSLLRFVDGTTAFPVGNGGFNPAVLNLSSFESAGVRVEDEVYENYFPSVSVETENAVNRAWYLSKPTNAGTADFTVSWKSSDALTGFNPSACALKYYDFGSQTWVGLPYSAAGFDGEFYSQTYSGLTNFNTYFAVFSAGPCENTFSNQTVIACAEYLSPSGDETWTMSGIYNDTIPNALGCDSILTIDLTINPTYAETISETACGSFAFDGVEYTSSGVYELLYLSIAGCDSIITLDLTIYDSNEAVCASLGGSVDLSSGCLPLDLRVQLYIPGTGILVEEFNTTIEADGTFSVQYFSPGIYDIYLKPEAYLQKIYASVEIVAGNNVLSEEVFIAGDLDFNNGVNIMDVSTFCQFFGSSVGDSNYDSMADLNCDGFINIVDVSILNASFGQIGDAPPPIE